MLARSRKSLSVADTTNSSQSVKLTSVGVQYCVINHFFLNVGILTVRNISRFSSSTVVAFVGNLIYMGFLIVPAIIRIGSINLPYLPSIVALTFLSKSCNLASSCSCSSVFENNVALVAVKLSIPLPCCHRRLLISSSNFCCNSPTVRSFEKSSVTLRVIVPPHLRGSFTLISQEYSCRAVAITSLF